METYYTYNEATKQLTPAKRVLVLENKTMILGNAADFAKYLGAYPKGESAPPAVDEDFHAVPDGYELKDGKWVKLWRVEPIQYTYDDYNRALEDYIREVRFERGYDEREPSPYYDNSEVHRWRTDAKDFREFRDKVMLYGLPILNKYKNNEEVPTLAKFKAGFPKIVWTFKEEK